MVSPVPPPPPRTATIGSGVSISLSGGSSVWVPLTVSEVPLIIAPVGENFTPGIAPGWGLSDVSVLGGSVVFVPTSFGSSSSFSASLTACAIWSVVWLVGWATLVFSFFALPFASAHKLAISCDQVRFVYTSPMVAGVNLKSGMGSPDARSVATGALPHSILSLVPKNCPFSTRVFPGFGG